MPQSLIHIISQFLVCRSALVLQRQRSRHSKPAINSFSCSSSVASAGKGRDTYLRFEANNSVELDKDARFAVLVSKVGIAYSRTVFQPVTLESADLLLTLGVTIWSSLFVISGHFCQGRGMKGQLYDGDLLLKH